MPSNGGSVEPYVVRNRLLRVRREVDVLDAGLRVTIAVSSRTGLPIRFQIYDPLPAALQVDDIGFHPDHEPKHGHIDEQMAVIGGVIDPDQELEVVYGLCPAQPRTPTDVEELQRDHRPSIEIDEIIGPEHDAEADLEHATATRSSASQSEQAETPRRIGSLWGFDSGSDGSSGEADESETSKTRIEEAVEEGDDEDEHWSDALFGEGTSESAEQPNESDDAVEQDSAPSGKGVSGGDPFGESPASGKLAAEISRAASERALSGGVVSTPDDEGDLDIDQPESEEKEDTGLAEPTAGPGTEDRTPVDSDTVERLVREIEVGTLTDEQYRRLATHLEEAGFLSVGDRKATSPTTRVFGLDELESTLATVRAAVSDHVNVDEHLAELEDTYRTTNEALDRLESSLDTVEERMGSSERLDAAMQWVEELERLAQSAADEVAAERAVHSARRHRLERQLGDLDNEEALSSDLETDLSDLVEVAREIERHRRDAVRALRELSSESGK